jgi:two-component system KDP operon response regulator KdpE
MATVGAAMTDPAPVEPSAPLAMTPQQPVLLVGPPEDDDVVRLGAAMGQAGWTSLVAPDAERGRWLASIQKVALVVVAGNDGGARGAVDVIRPVSTAPLVVLGTPSADAVVELIAAGVDAVIDAHAGPTEVVARLAALLRRSEGASAPGVRFLRAGALTVDLAAQECELDGRPLALSPTERAVLTLLMARPDEALPTHAIVRRVWGWTPTDGRNALRIVVNRLRRKLDDDPRSPRYIAAVRGVGYRFVAGVVELGDSAPAPPDVTVLLGWVEELAVALLDCATVAAAGERLLDALDASGYADALALFQVRGGAMQLVTARGMSSDWLARVGGGVPLDPSFASAQSVLTGQPVQFGDIRTVGGHFRATAAQLLDEGVRAGHFLPVPGQTSVWGSLGLGRRSGQPFDEHAMAFCRALAAVFAARASQLAT